jgi:hypothetical protein
MLDDEVSKCLYFRKSKQPGQSYGAWKNKNVYTFPNILFEPIAAAVASKLLSHLPKKVATLNISEEMQKQYDAKYWDINKHQKDTGLSTNSDNSDNEWDFNLFLNERQQRTMQKLVLSLKAHSEGKKLSTIQSNLCKLFGDMSGSIEEEKKSLKESLSNPEEQKNEERSNVTPGNDYDADQSSKEESDSENAPHTAVELVIEDPKSSDSEFRDTADNGRDNKEKQKNKDGLKDTNNQDKDNVAEKTKEAALDYMDKEKDLAVEDNEAGVAEKEKEAVVEADDLEHQEELSEQAENDSMGDFSDNADKDEKTQQDEVSKRDKFNQFVEKQQDVNNEDVAAVVEEEEAEEVELLNKDLENKEEKSDSSKKRKQEEPLSAISKRIRKKKTPFTPN